MCGYGTKLVTGTGAGSEMKLKGVTETVEEEP